MAHGTWDPRRFKVGEAEAGAERDDCNGNGRHPRRHVTSATTREANHGHDCDDYEYDD